MAALRQDGLADETVGPNMTWLDLSYSSVKFSEGDDHGKFVEDLWRLNVWIEDLVCYNYSNLESVTNICSYS
jgi:hypothetical protein